MLNAQPQTQNDRAESRDLEKARGSSRGQYGGPGKSINPKSSAIHRAMGPNKLAGRGLSIFATEDSYDCVGGQLTRTQRVINSFAGKWFDHARGIADEEQILVRG